MSQYKAVLWDVDGTLLDFLYAQRRAIIGCLKTIGWEATEEMVSRYSEINDGYWKRLELGLVTKEELHIRRFTDLFDEYGIVGVNVEAFRREYLETLSNTYAYMENSLELCKSLNGRVKQYVITNGVTSVQEKKLQLSGFYDLMDKIFISEQIGAPKPKSEFFDYCLKAMDEAVDRKELLIVGDSLTSDIKGGVLYGIPTCWYRPEDTLEKEPSLQMVYDTYKPDYEIAHLHELYRILGISEEKRQPWQNPKDKS